MFTDYPYFNNDSIIEKNEKKNNYGITGINPKLYHNKKVLKFFKSEDCQEKPTVPIKIVEDTPKILADFNHICNTDYIGGLAKLDVTESECTNLKGKWEGGKCSVIFCKDGKYTIGEADQKKSTRKALAKLKMEKSMCSSLLGVLGSKNDNRKPLNDLLLSEKSPIPTRSENQKWYDCSFDIVDQDESVYHVVSKDSGCLKKKVHLL